jgi:hypothetical protein
MITLASLLFISMLAPLKTNRYLLFLKRLTKTNSLVE